MTEGKALTQCAAKALVTDQELCMSHRLGALRTTVRIRLVFLTAPTPSSSKILLLYHPNVQRLDRVDSFHDADLEHSRRTGFQGPLCLSTDIFTSTYAVVQAIKAPDLF